MRPILAIPRDVPRDVPCHVPRRATRTAVLLVLTLAAPTAVLAPEPSAASTSAPTPVVRWSDTDVVAGRTSTATVLRRTRPAGSRLVLQRKHLDRWRVADRTAERHRRGFRLDVPTDQYGWFRFRVVARAGGRVVATSAPQRVRVRPPYELRGRARQHTFQTKTVTRWNSCRPIRWTFSPDRSPRRALRQLRTGVRRVAAATGLDFRYVGTTEQRPNPYGTGVQGARVIIGWRKKAYFTRTAGTRITGMGGNTFSSGFREADGTRVFKAHRGGVVLNAGMRDRLDRGFGRGHTWGEVIIHELAHVLGLGHVEARSQVMFPRTAARDAAWGAGDLAGLRRLGDTRGCIEPVPGRTVARMQQRDH